MKKYIVGAVMTVAMLFASVASAEFVIGVQGGRATVDFDKGTLQANGLGEFDCPCVGDDDFGLGFYAQALTTTQSGNAFGIHVAHSSYSIEAKILQLDIELDVDVLDVLGVMRWKNNIFVMAGLSKFDASGDYLGFVNRYDPGKAKIDGNGLKLAAGFDIGKGSLVVSPAVEYADYGDGITKGVVRIGIGYRFN